MARQIHPLTHLRLTPLTCTHPALTLAQGECMVSAGKSGVAWVRAK
jgi:hypothetical protein